MTRLVLVDDQSLVQQGVATLLELTGQIEVVGRFLSGAQLLQWLDQQQEMPDLILLDFHMPHQDGLEVFRELQKRSTVPVGFLSTFSDPALSREARRSGAAGWLPKSVELDELVEGINRMVQGEAVFPALHGHEPETDLSLREYEIARCLVAGMTNQQIADECHLSLGTIKNYMSNLFAKLEVTNRTQAVAALRRLGVN